MEKIKGRGHRGRWASRSRSVVSSNECERTRAKEAFLARARAPRATIELIERREREKPEKNGARAVWSSTWKPENENAGIPQLGSKMRGIPAFSGPRDMESESVF